MADEDDRTVDSVCQVTVRAELCYKSGRVRQDAIGSAFTRRC